MPQSIKTIPATERWRQAAAGLPGAGKRRVAAYARVSTDREEQLTSYEAQVDYYTKYIQEKPEWEFVGIYSDEGISGIGTKNRDGFQRMVADALAGKIDLILTKSVSRFARNTLDSITTIRELKKHGTECYFEKENIWTFDSKGELMLTIMASIAQEESRSISENVKWGERKRFAEGKPILAFSNFLGYDRGPDGNLVVNEEQALTVRRIYDMFLDGYSPGRIAAILSKSRVPTAAGKYKWNASAIERILVNEKYVGDLLLQKSYVPDFLTKKQVPNRGELPQYYVQDNHEPIVSREVFALAQGQLARIKREGILAVQDTVFSHMIRCGECGETCIPMSWANCPYGGKVYYRRAWQCRNKYRGKTCSPPAIREEDLQARFLQAAKSIFANKKQYIQAFEENTEKHFGYTDLEQELAALEANSDDSPDYEARRQELQDRILDCRLARYRAGNYLQMLQQAKKITAFTKKRFLQMVDHVTIYSILDVRFTFKDGTVITPSCPSFIDPKKYQRLPRRKPTCQEA